MLDVLYSNGVYTFDRQRLLTQEPLLNYKLRYGLLMQVNKAFRQQGDAWKRLQKYGPIAHYMAPEASRRTRVKMLSASVLAGCLLYLVISGRWNPASFLGAVNNALPEILRDNMW